MNVHESHVMEKMPFSFVESECVKCRCCTCHNPLELGVLCRYDGRTLKSSL